MIAAFFDKLFAMGDQAKEEFGADSPQYKTIHQIQQELQEIYDIGIRDGRTINGNGRPATSLEERLAFSAKGVKAKLDPQDNTIYYITKTHVFSNPQEVLTYLLETRARKYRMEIQKAYESAVLKCFTKQTRTNIDKIVDFEDLPYDPDDIYKEIVGEKEVSK